MLAAMRSTAIALCCMLCPVIAAGDAGKPADLMSGVWHGTLTAGGTACQMFIRVQGSGQAFGGQGIVWHGLTEDQAQAAARGQKPQAEVPGWLCVVQQFAIKLDGDTATFQGTAVQSLFGGTKYRPDVFVGKLTPPGVIAGNASDAKKSEGLFRLYKEGALAKPLPLDVAKEKAAQLGCVDGGKYHYTVYVPKSYTPEKATPLLINFNPGGNGQPLSTKMAEETGWIMAGLTESQNGPTEPISENRDAALFDLRRRFNIDMKHVYFSGLSGGARASAASGQAYPGICAGLILIGAAYAQGAPPKDQAIFYLTGQTDMNKGEVSGAYEKAKSAGRKCQLVVHPGGHDWGRAEDHEAAIRWLAQETLGAKAPDKKKP